MNDATSYKQFKCEDCCVSNTVGLMMPSAKCMKYHIAGACAATSSNNIHVSLLNEIVRISAINDRLVNEIATVKKSLESAEAELWSFKRQQPTPEFLDDSMYVVITKKRRCSNPR